MVHPNKDVTMGLDWVEPWTTTGDWIKPWTITTYPDTTNYTKWIHLDYPPTEDDVMSGKVFKVKEEDEYTYIELCLPGWSKEDISVSMEGDKLIVTGCIKIKPRSQFKPTNFTRSFAVLPDSNVTASYEYGILYISVEKPTKKSITIKVQ